MSRKKCKGRDISGVLILNKHLGCSSNQALQQAKRLFGAAKAGHTGSLDPLATGVLPVCLGEATKFAQFLLDADKSYRVEAKLGVTTRTGDAEGEIVRRRPVDPEIDQAVLSRTLSTFVGKQCQVPSVFSAIKHQGKPLYEYARRGIDIQPVAREIVIHQLLLVRFEAPKLEMVVSCSKGTYIRSLVEDIGESLGCGAYVTSLERIQCGPFNLSQSVTIDELASLQSTSNDGPCDLQRHLLPVSSMTGGWPQVQLSEQAGELVLQGQTVCTERLDPGFVQIYVADEFLGVGQIKEPGKLCAKRLMRTDKIKYSA